jgi:hypothetical protein
MNQIYNTKWQNNQYPDTITISKIYFEHLLNFLANQKFIDKLSPDMKKENQLKIDKAWRQGMFVHGLNITTELAHNQMFEKYCKFWNKNRLFINNCITQDFKQYPNDKNIGFKWTQLVKREIEMWMLLCCFSSAIIDCENEKYEHGVVSLQDFNDIVYTRGFTTRMKKFLVDILNDIGIGEQLSKENP